jgi:uncharacterized membrane protein
LIRILDRLRKSLWLIPLACIAAGVALSLVLTQIDEASGYTLVLPSITGTATAVQQVLSTAASALLSLTSVVLSLTLVAVQLAMGQFSPRIVAALLGDRRSQLSIGLFLGTFAYLMVVLRAVNDQGPNGGIVPGLSVMVGYGLIAASVCVLVLYVHHAGQSIRASGLIDLVGDNTRAEITRLYPNLLEDARRHDGADGLRAGDAGNIVKVHRQTLVAAAQEAGVVIELTAPVGDFVPTGGTVLRVREGELGPDRQTAFLDCVVIGPERTHRGDPAYGLRKLVDIAERTIASSPFDDPTTTVQALHRIHDVMRMLAAREFPSGRHHDSDGVLRFVEPVFDWDAYVRLAFDEIRLAGAGSPQVTRRLRCALLDLKEVAPPDRQGPLDEQLTLLDAAVRRQFEDDADVRMALQADSLGIGVGARDEGSSNGAAARSSA